MRSENLDELPEVQPAKKITSFFSRLMESEILPLDAEVAGGRLSARTSGLLAAEELPLDHCPGPCGGRASFFATLFSRESLPVDPEPGPGPVGRAPGR